jgi:hypothetical protein
METSPGILVVRTLPPFIRREVLMRKGRYVHISRVQPERHTLSLLPRHVLGCNFVRVPLQPFSPHSTNPRSYRIDLRPFRPTPKFLCVKGIIFFSFWQGLLVSILVALGWIHSCELSILFCMIRSSCGGRQRGWRRRNWRWRYKMH